MHAETLRVESVKTTVCRIFSRPTLFDIVWDPPPRLTALRRGRCEIAPLSASPHNSACRAEARSCKRRKRPQATKFAGGHRIRVTPVPIPNTEVKPDTADGTVWETVWESRSLPALIR